MSRAQQQSAGDGSGAGTDADPVAPESAPRTRRSRLSRRTTVLTGLVAAGLLAATTRTTWVQATAPDLAGTAQEVAVKGADAAPAVLALALAALAAAAATSLSSRWVRFLTGPVLIAAGVGAGLSSLAPLRDPAAAAGSAVAETTGVVGAQVSADATSWPLLALVPALAVVAVGAIVLIVGGSWPVGSRYRSAAVTTAADPAEDPAAAWDALTRGEDPSLLDGEAEVDADAAAEGAETTADPADPHPGAAPGDEWPDASARR